MEELRFYLDLVNELGDPFTVFERDWEEPEEPEPGRHSVSPPAPVSALQRLDNVWVPGTYDEDLGFPG